MLTRRSRHFTFALSLLFAWLGAADFSVAGSLVPGPDIIVGDVPNLAVYGASGTSSSQLGLGMGTDSCNAGNVQVDFIPLPNTSHAVIAQNLYRMSGGTGNAERFEQVGQAWIKHTFGSANADECGFGCSASESTHLEPGCSDPYFSSQNAMQNGLGSRAWVNPFTGVFPSNAMDHTGHTETGTSHRLLVERNDLVPATNPGATYYAEVQYVTPSEYAWCQAHPGECNMFNNVSYRRFSVGADITFAPAENTVRMSPALNAWSGATITAIEPVPGEDGRAFIASKVSGPAGGMWHYEYAIYNMNLDRAIQSVSVPLGGTIAVSNAGFHAPLNHPGFPHDGTLGDAGYSNAAWSSNETASSLSWSSETFAQNQNANAIRWGTLYNFRFDSNRPPHAATATIGFFKTGTPFVAAIQGPDPSNATPTATPSATGTPPPATPTPVPTATPIPNGYPMHALNLSTRMRVGTGDSAAIAGFIINGRTRIVLRGLGPTLEISGVPNVLADPVLELHGPFGFDVRTNDNWRDDPEAILIQGSNLAPFYDLEAATGVLLEAGSYTAILQGKNDTSGAALVEIYNLGRTPYFPLQNISTRGLVGTGNDVVIAGFILSGEWRNPPATGPGRIVIRGLGPILALYGIPNALADPTLELRDSNGALLIANNNWQDDPAQAAELSAAHLAPLFPEDAAIAIMLPAGAYTAILAGLNGGTGVGLVEVYDRGAQ
ncbi:MAG TPA: hypothetical protein VJU77_10070 [Chthoniobacterales bacterium]|nr:hypothetical protein [Chthoniobacterales bacterium]